MSRLVDQSIKAGKFLQIDRFLHGEIAPVNFRRDQREMVQFCEVEDIVVMAVFVRSLEDRKGSKPNQALDRIEEQNKEQNRQGLFVWCSAYRTAFYFFSESSQVNSPIYMACLFATLSCAEAEQRHEQGFTDDDQIEQKRLVLNVIKVMIDVGVDGQGAIGGNLPETGDTWLDVEPFAFQ